MSEVYHSPMLRGKHVMLHLVRRGRGGSRCSVFRIRAYCASGRLCIGTTMEARRRSSLSSHSLAIQSLMARQKAAARASLKIAGAPCRTLQMAWRVWKASRAGAFRRGKSVPALPLAGFQSGRALIGAFGGKALAV